MKTRGMAMKVEFEKFLARHGEVVAQAILENLERYEGVRSDIMASLEDRWMSLTQDNLNEVLTAA
jgi:hypothetical protein